MIDTNIEPWVSAAKAIFFGLASVLVIPRREYKRLFVYALLLGGAADAINVILLTLLHLHKYQNSGPFSVYGYFSYWTPLAWTFTFILFFHFLPTRRILLYPYTVAFGSFGYMLGVVLENFNTFRYIGFWRYAAPFYLIAWFSLAAWAYLKMEGIKIR